MKKTFLLLNWWLAALTALSGQTTYSDLVARINAQCTKGVGCDLENHLNNTSAGQIFNPDGTVFFTANEPRITYLVAKDTFYVLDPADRQWKKKSLLTIPQWQAARYRSFPWPPAADVKTFEVSDQEDTDTDSYQVTSKYTKFIYAFSIDQSTGQLTKLVLSDLESNIPVITYTFYYEDIIPEPRPKTTVAYEEALGNPSVFQTIVKPIPTPQPVAAVKPATLEKVEEIFDI